MAEPDRDPPITIQATVAAFPGRPFAVIDGGLFEDLPKLLRRERLFGRSLFLDHADQEVEKAGPWLVMLDQEPRATEKVFALIGDRPAVVFWSCPGGEATLYRHLRTLNMARIPDWAARGASGPSDPTASDVYEPVMFRHWDPRVLGALMPVLDESQFAKVLGPAEEIAYFAEAFGGLKRVVSDPTWSPPRPGPLTLRGPQAAELIERRVAASHRGLASYLRQYAPDHVAHLDDAGLRARVRLYEAQARDLGVRNEDAIARWSFMQVTSRTDLSRDVAVTSFIGDIRAGTTPDERMNELMRHRTRILKRVFG